jgi:hypothetical protein
LQVHAQSHRLPPSGDNIPQTGTNICELAYGQDSQWGVGQGERFEVFERVEEDEDDDPIDFDEHTIVIKPEPI